MLALLKLSTKIDRKVEEKNTIHIILVKTFLAVSTYRSSRKQSLNEYKHLFFYYCHRFVATLHILSEMDVKWRLFVNKSREIVQCLY